MSYYFSCITWVLLDEETLEMDKHAIYNNIGQIDTSSSPGWTSHLFRVMLFLQNLGVFDWNGSPKSHDNYIFEKANTFDGILFCLWVGWKEVGGKGYLSFFLKLGAMEQQFTDMSKCPCATHAGHL